MNSQWNILSLGAIQMIRDTLGEGGGGSQIVTKYHQGGGGLTKVSHEQFFCDFLNT